MGGAVGAMCVASRQTANPILRFGLTRVNSIGSAGPAPIAQSPRTWGARFSISQISEPQPRIA
jgi:hypothetical protein